MEEVIMLLVFEGNIGVLNVGKKSVLFLLPTDLHPLKWYKARPAIITFNLSTIQVVAICIGLGKSIIDHIN